MKKLTYSLLVAFALVGTSFAGREVVSYSGKGTKEVAPAETCFLDQELQLDIYGAYVDGNRPHAGPIREHGWGGGVGINYFFSRMIGVGVDATWIYADDNDGDNDNNHDDNTIIHNFSGSLIFRFPSDETCLAPYVFVGGGFHVDGEQWASAHAGVGLEYRIVPNKIGIFTDARFTYFGDRFGDGDQNNIMARAGVRVVF
jgi:opacity protein-like surface antigen